MSATDYPTAWDHPPTRAAWIRHMVMNVVGQIGWITAFPGLLYTMVVFTFRTYVLAFTPFILYALYRAVAQTGHFHWAFRMRRILRTYPWQILEDVPSGLGKYPGARDDGIWFEFRDPANPEEKIPLVFVRHQRSYWWLKRMNGPRTKPRRRTQIEPLWFAGDPRFLAVIAAPSRNGQAPKRLHVLYQRPVFDSRRAPDTWGAGAADIERARRAGAPHVAITQRPSVQPQAHRNGERQ